MQINFKYFNLNLYDVQHLYLFLMDYKIKNLPPNIKSILS